MTLAPWRSLIARALHRNRSQPHSRYFQLATVNLQGLPTNRTVVFRGFLDNTNQLQIITDLRSEKVTHIEQQSWGEICWYFTKTREQFRLAGNLVLITSDCPELSLSKQRKQVWQNLSDSAKFQFAWPTPKDLKLPVETSKEVEKVGKVAEKKNYTDPLDNFCLLLLNPQTVDHLELKGDPQNRNLYIKNRDEFWSSQEVNP